MSSMQHDFTIAKYRSLLAALNEGGYQSVFRFGDTPSGHAVMLRHDVDLRPGHSLRIAQIEAEMGMKSLFYFRAVPESWDESVILQIAEMGHEVGYHYESLTTCHGDMEAAFEDFKTNLKKLSDLIGKPVSSICMHGSPRSRFDSKDLWSQFDYKTLGVDYEPFIDTDFSSTFYLTDTGRRWDGFKVSVRDKIPLFQEKWNREGLTFHTTDQVIAAIASATIQSRYPNLMITTHPQRWMPFGMGWIKEMAHQNLKNIVKGIIVSSRSKQTR